MFKSLSTFCIFATLLFAFPAADAMGNLVFTITPNPIVETTGSGNTGALTITVENNFGFDVDFANELIGTSSISSDDLSVAIVGNSAPSTIAQFFSSTPVTIADGGTYDITGLTYTTTAMVNSDAVISGDFTFLYRQSNFLGAPVESGTANVTAAFSAIPEPSTITTFCAGIAALFFRRRRRI